MEQKKRRKRWTKAARKAHSRRMKRMWKKRLEGNGNGAVHSTGLPEGMAIQEERELWIFDPREGRVIGHFSA